MGRDLAGWVHHGHLAVHLPLVGGEERPERLGRALSTAHEVEAERAVPHLHQGLGGDGAHPGLGPRHELAQCDCTAAPSSPVRESRAAIE